MSLSDDFDALQQQVNAEPDHVSEARRRRSVILGAFDGEADVLETVPSGSLARGSQIDPIHDVDLIVVFDPDQYPSWGQPGGSAREALNWSRRACRRSSARTRARWRARCAVPT